MLGSVGLEDIKISYIGGLQMMFIFKSTLEARNFQTQRESVWKKYFHSLSIWDGEDIPYQRIAGLKIKGVPFILRDTCTFDRIGEVFGRTIMSSEFTWDDDDNSHACCYVLTNLGNRIEEEIVINWRNTSYPVWVNEEMNSWSPLFVEYNQTKEAGDETNNRYYNPEPNGSETVT
ncbi:hypothetical protein L1987_61788 [Smallanthus sonchifolius]|uniref:Uncharacterized protein n=1 Tax=Smallanthus sonchifolius TaxID=185202 RepID=A0ACB9C8L2_9ASTR|nr:hypothetical protein L1987_61788 [Smallanthus sonchifolius]